MAKNPKSKGGSIIAIAAVGAVAYILLSGKGKEKEGGAGGSYMPTSEMNPYSPGEVGGTVTNVFQFPGMDTTKKQAAVLSPTGARTSNVLTAVFPSTGRKEYVTPSGNAFYTSPKSSFAMPVDINPQTGLGYSVAAGTKSSLLHLSKKEQAAKLSPYALTTEKTKYGVHTGK